MQLSPAWHELRVQSECLAEPLGCGHSLVRGLAVDEQNSGKREDKIGMPLQGHEFLSVQVMSRPDFLYDVDPHRHC